MVIRLFNVLILAVLVLSSGARAETPATDSPAANDDGACTGDQKITVTTQHTATIGGKKLDYAATVGFLDVKLPSKASACIFFTYYKVKTDTAAARPLTFAFNGGPGSASLWLHLGFMGPKRVDMGADGLTPPLPFQLIDNEDSPIDFTDVVMIDPVATGFSHAVKDSTNSQFFGAKNDAMSVATFVRNFLDLFNRRSSPLYVLGESYGGIRGSLVAQNLQSTFNIPLKGLVLVSPWLSSTTTNFNEDDNDVPYLTFFPTFATTAWYHKKAAPELLAMDVGAVYKAARAFANTRYRAALAQGNELDSKEFDEVARTVSSFTGISPELVQSWNLRIQDTQFFGGLLARNRQVVGRFDSRFMKQRLIRQDGSNATDPSDSSSGYAFVPAINSYLRNDLGFTPATPYVDSANIDTWAFDSDSSEFSVTRNLSQALVDNPKLNVFVASGYYDLACPMGTEDFERERLDPSVKASRMAIHRYEAGHMMYINPAVLHQLKADLATYYGVPQNQQTTTTLP